MKERPLRAAFAAFLLPMMLLPVSAGAEIREIPVGCMHPLFPDADARGVEKTGESALLTFGGVPSIRFEKRNPAPDSISALTILYDWNEVPHNEERDRFYYQSYLFSSSPTRDRTLRDYYKEVSNDRFRLGGTVTPWYRSNLSLFHFADGDRTPGTIDDFGFDTSDEAFAASPYPRNVWGIVLEAVDLLDAGGFDFTQYDNDGPDGVPNSGDDDGVIDAIIILHAGLGGEAVLVANQIWSHQSDFRDPGLVARLGEPSVDGIRLGSYMMVPEIGQIGVYCHEFGHVLGLPDLYRTVTGDGFSTQESVVGIHCLMDAGGLTPFFATNGDLPGSTPTHMNPFLKDWLGWIDIDALERTVGAPDAFPGTTLDPVETGGRAIRLLANPGGNDWNDPASQFGEYFMLENRRRQRFDRYLPGEGLLIWHINERYIGNDDENPDRRLVTLVEADGGSPRIGEIDLGSITDYWPFGGQTDWTSSTVPSTDLAGGALSFLAVTNIRRTGSSITLDIDLGAEEAGALLVYPNPFSPDDEESLRITFRPAGSAATAPPRVDIYDVSGQLVRQLDAGAEIDASSFSAFWDGTNESGNTVAAGTYFLIIHAENEMKNAAVGVLR
ncbi:MAG: M6 family metalloprotease domain-containing protein [Gemmatimonadetes bacterium]|nr:M6 family metalloprotease domain-containing protein [Gemmatimonadota bacterium]